MSAANESDARLRALEERASFQERTIEHLNDVVLEQQTEMKRLAREMRQCRAAIERLNEAAFGDDLPHEKPPHY